MDIGTNRLDIDPGVIEIECAHKTDVWQDVLRCLRVLYGSEVGSLALDRDFGIDWSFLDQPILIARAMLESELIQKTRRYETRANITEVTWSGDAMQGQMIPKVVVELV